VKFLATALARGWIAAGLLNSERCHYISSDRFAFFTSL
jgi:hypothetical protein